MKFKKLAVIKLTPDEIEALKNKVTLVIEIEKGSNKVVEIKQM